MRVDASASRRTERLRGGICACTALLMLAVACARPAGESRDVPVDEEAYRAEVERWRAEKEESLKAEEGWLTVAGLFVLEEGTSKKMGSAEASDFRLPADAAPPLVGIVELSRGRVFITLAEGAFGSLNDEPAPEAFELEPAHPSDGTPADRLAIDRLTLAVHRSGSRTALRVRDPEGPVMQAFAGLRWFPIDARYRLSARFIPYAEPRAVATINVLGDEVTMQSPGEAEMVVDGHTVRLQAWDDDGRLWFVFRDRSAGTDTYGIRQVYADPPRDGRLTLDFNQSDNTPCAYNPYTTCPNPPPENVLREIAIPAGERIYEGPNTEALRQR